MANFGVKISGDASVYSWYKVRPIGPRVLLISGALPFLSVANAAADDVARYIGVASDNFGNTVESG